MLKHITLSIRTKIVLITGTFVIFAMGVSTFINSRILIRGYSDALKSETLSICQSLKLQLDRILKLGIEIGDISGFENQCRETVEKYHGISYAMVMDIDGRILFHNDTAMHDRRVSDTAILKAVKSRQNVIQPYLEKEAEYYDVIIPVSDTHGQHVGAVRIGFPENIISRKVSLLLGYAIEITVITTGLAIILSVFAFSVWVTDPIKKLISVIQDIKAERTDLTKRVEIHSQDEIGILAFSFNEMIEELQNTQNQLIQSAKLASIGELSAGIAHELNQPLMVIRTTVQLINRYIAKGQTDICRFSEQLEKVEKNTSRMMNIINHLRTFSRQSATKFVSVNVSSVIEDAFMMIGEQLRLRGIVVEKQFYPDLPEIYGNPNQLEQVFLNLIANARDAIAAKSENDTQHVGKLEIITKISDHCESDIEILFRDNGGGIPEAIRHKIFDPFFTTKDVGKGTGLGLSISYGIIRDHHGSIDIAETSPAGTVFRIILPVAPASKA